MEVYLRHSPVFFKAILCKQSGFLSFHLFKYATEKNSFLMTFVEEGFMCYSFLRFKEKNIYLKRTRKSTRFVKYLCTIYTQRLHFKSQLIGAAQSQEQLWVTLFLWFFYDPTCTNKIFHRFQTADVSGTISMALLSEGQQMHPAASKTRKHINIWLFLPTRE